MTTSEVCAVIADSGILRIPREPLPTGAQIFESMYYQSFFTLHRLYRVAVQVVQTRYVLQVAARLEGMPWDTQTIR